MIESLSREVEYVQNAALGAVLVWRFSVGYTEAQTNSDSPVLPLGFLVLPILLHQETFELLRSTNKPSGLHGFAGKFSRPEIGRADLLLGVHTRAVALRDLSIHAVQAGVRHSLFTLAARDAKIMPLTSTKATGVASSVRPLLDGAEKLGYWMSQLSLFEVASTLRVAL